MDRVALAVPDVEHTTAAVDIRDAEPDHFADAQPRRVGRQEDRPVLGLAGDREDAS